MGLLEQETSRLAAGHVAAPLLFALGSSDDGKSVNPASAFGVLDALMRSFVDRRRSWGGVSATNVLVSFVGA